MSLGSPGLHSNGSAWLQNREYNVVVVWYCTGVVYKSVPGIEKEMNQPLVWWCGVCVVAAHMVSAACAYAAVIRYNVAWLAEALFELANQTKRTHAHTHNTSNVYRGGH